MLRVMLVDDERMALEGLQILIDWEKHGFEVCALCQSGEEALSKYAEARPDLVVTDMYMPNVDGLALMGRLRALGYKGQFLIVSGYGDFEKAQKAIKHNVADYLLKPIDADEADKAIERAKRALLAENAPGKASESHVPDAVIMQALSTRSESISDTVKRLAKERVSESLTLESLAAQMGYNPAYLGRAFREETGVAFRIWLSSYRVTRAADILKTTDASVREVSAAVGYQKYQNFLQAFKAHYGLSPQEYRRTRVR